MKKRRPKKRKGQGKHDRKVYSQKWKIPFLSPLLLPFHPLCSITPKLLFLSDWAFSGRCPQCLSQWNCNVFQVSVWVSLGVLRPGLLLLVKAPQKMLITRLYPEPLFPHVWKSAWYELSSTWHTTKASHCESHTILWCQGSFRSSPGGWASELVVSWEYQRAVRMTRVPLWAWGEYMQNKQHSLN